MKLITPQELVMSILAFVLSIITGFLVNWEIPKLIENQTIIAYFLIAGVIGSLIYGWKPRFDRFFQKHDNKSNTSPENHISLEKKEEHTHELNEKIFKRLATLAIRQDTKDNSKLYVDKSEQHDDPRYSNIIYTKGDSTVILLDKLPQPYYDWAFKHLEHEEYADNILKPFKKLEKLIQEYNEIERKYRKVLEDAIESKLNESFSDCTIYTKTIGHRIDREIWVENPEHRFADLIKDRFPEHEAIMPKGFPIEHPYIICKTITDEQLEQFKEILNSIMNSDEFLITNKEQMKILNEMNTVHKLLKNNFKRLSDELDPSGSIIKGQCKRPY